MSSSPQEVPIHPMPPVGPPQPPHPSDGSHRVTYSVAVSGPAPTSGTFDSLDGAMRYARESLRQAEAMAEHSTQAAPVPATATISQVIAPVPVHRPKENPLPIGGHPGSGVVPPSPPPMAYPVNA